MGEIKHCVQRYTLRSPFHVNCEKFPQSISFTLAALLTQVKDIRCAIYGHGQVQGKGHRHGHEESLGVFKV